MVLFIRLIMLTVIADVCWTMDILLLLHMQYSVQ